MFTPLNLYGHDVRTQTGSLLAAHMWRSSRGILKYYVSSGFGSCWRRKHRFLISRQYQEPYVPCAARLTCLLGVFLSLRLLFRGRTSNGLWNYASRLWLENIEHHNVECLLHERLNNNSSYLSYWKKKWTGFRFKLFNKFLFTVSNNCFTFLN